MAIARKSGKNGVERVWQLGGFGSKVIENRVERHVTP